MTSQSAEDIANRIYEKLRKLYPSTYGSSFQASITKPAMEIAALLSNEANPYVKVEISADGIKIVSTEAYIPVKTTKD